MFVELLSELDATAAPGTGFYTSISEAVCRLTSMERAVLFLYDAARQRVTAEGAHGLGLDPAALSDVRGSVADTPMARRALAEDRVVVSDRIEEDLPPAGAPFGPMTTLTCTPVSGGGRWFGVIFADRGGDAFTLGTDEAHAMWTLGKVTALAASARIATRQQERARGLAARLDLARDIHERVVQRVFGVSLVLGAEGELSREDRARAGSELHAALADLREAIGRPLAARPRDTDIPLREEIERLRGRYPALPISVHFGEGETVPPDLEPLAQSTLGEALRNVHKHADPSEVEIRVSTEGGALVLEVENDGVRPARRGSAGVGLRLIAFEALQAGGVLEFGTVGSGRWRVRLVGPDDPA